jgi:hypothetical protein
MIHVNHGPPAPNGTRVVITGAGGNIGRGLAPRPLAAGYALTLSDLKTVDGLVAEARFAAADVRMEEGLQTAMVDADVLVHLPALHGIHAERWELNVRAHSAPYRRPSPPASGKWSGFPRRHGMNPTASTDSQKSSKSSFSNITGGATASHTLRSVPLRSCPGQTGPVTVDAPCSTSVWIAMTCWTQFSFQWTGWR